MMKSYLKSIIATIFILASTSALAQLNGTEKKLVKYIDQNNDDAIALLKKVVNINSGTMNFEGVKEVGMIFMEEFNKLGMQTEWIDGTEFNRAGHMVAKIEGGKGPKIVMIGHLDTVFEKDSPNQEWIPQDGNIVKGPGIADMKGGDVIILKSLAALKSIGLLKKLNITVVLTGEEEKSGKPLEMSKKALIDAAKWADIALGFENGDGNPGTAIVARRSSSSWKLEVTGNAAHSSQIFKPHIGAGAIYELSRILYKFYDELSGEEFLTFNPGVVLGGTEKNHEFGINKGDAFGKNNVVSKTASAAGDIRCISVEQLEKTKQKMTEIVADNLPGTTATITFNEGYLPFAPTDGNYELLAKYNKASQDLGQGEVVAGDPINAGAADISFTSAYVKMGIDGMGLGGADDHTVNETGDISTVASQTKRAAVLIYRLSKE